MSRLRRRYIRRLRGRRVRNRPSHGRARPWYPVPPTDAARHQDQGHLRSAWRCPRRPACRPISRSDGHLSRPAHSPLRQAQDRLAGMALHLLDVADAVDRIRRTQANGMSAAIARSIIFAASAGLVANAVPSGTCAAARRTGLALQLLGR